MITVEGRKKPVEKFGKIGYNLISSLKNRLLQPVFPYLTTGEVESLQLFEAVPQDLFSVLASPNRALYAEALEVLYETYRDHLKIPETLYYSVLRNRMERQLAEATFDGEDIDEDELRDISGRARFLIRKLGSRGWFEKERGKTERSFEEYLIVPGYSSRLLELLHQLREDTPQRGYSYVFGTYSALKVAREGESAYEKMLALYSAYDNTMALIKALKSVYHNIKGFFRMQMEMQDVNDVLAAHFDDFGQRVMEAYIRPLKIRDSVPKYRVPIRQILSQWMEDDALLEAMAQAAFQDRRAETLEGCRADLLEKLYWIQEQYERMESDYLAEIDRQVRRYTRATTQKLEALSNLDRNLSGNLRSLLDALASGKGPEDLGFALYCQESLTEKSLWKRKRVTLRPRTHPVEVEEEPITDEAMAQAAELLQASYSREAVESYVLSRMGAETDCTTDDLPLHSDRDYVLSLLAALHGSDRESAYEVERMDGRRTENGYTLPQLRFVRKE